MKNDCLPRKGKILEVFVVHLLGTVVFGLACVCSVAYAFLKAHMQDISVFNVILSDVLFHVLPFPIFAVILRSFIRFFWQYTADAEGITVYRPFVRPVTYAWVSLRKIDVAMVAINRKEDAPVIRVFYGDTKLDWNKKQGLEVALALWDPVLLISYSEEQMAELRGFCPDIIQEQT